MYLVNLKQCGRKEMAELTYPVAPMEKSVMVETMAETMVGTMVLQVLPLLSPL